MQKFALACVAAMFMGNAASASDINTGSAKDRTVHQTPDDSWTGPYIGIHGGWAGGDWNGPLSYDDHDPKWPMPKYDFDDSDKKIDADGWLAGGQIGYDWQLGNSVIGIEGDLSYMDADGEGSFLPYPNNPGSPAWEIKSEIEMFGTLRGRLGILMTPDLLVYATGGLAFARVSSEISPVYDHGSNGHATDEKTHLGWTIGTGLEYRLDQGWTLRGEYLHAKLGEENYAYEGTTAGGAVYDTDHHHPDLTLHVIRGGLNYRF